jgi:2-polyprenyl-3-methyl-5-hydroxy-6-metoxy-1,4-benzoquinol methylase
LTTVAQLAVCDDQARHTGRTKGAPMSKQQQGRADDADGERRPTSHERNAGRRWDASYVEGPPPWDIGGPQPAISRLAGEGAFAGAVLDAGCGTGEHALLAASLGLRVLGVDAAETAVSIAREKAAARDLDAEFVVADALRLERLDRTFETVIDCGLLHTFDSAEREQYVTSLASVTRPGASVHVLCFSNVGPGTCGPHPVGEDELRAAFGGDGWSISKLAADHIHTRLVPPGFPAWLARIERI